MKLHSIGHGSTAEQHGFDMGLLIGWLEDIRDHEIERAETKPRYEARAHALSDLVDALDQLNNGARFEVELHRPRKRRTKL